MFVSKPNKDTLAKLNLTNMLDRPNYLCPEAKTSQMFHQILDILSNSFYLSILTPRWKKNSFCLVFIFGDRRVITL